ncbi:vWA domain-containing protein [Salinigranum salinum]|uniref:vWA domain-containing protein n=1 Tax=Salinigranum salinum TaxID=1364937 RepID=UPI001864E549|nr:vWA domain-containing protein [Salinigranum salinum]
MATTARISPNRADRIREFICGHLPDGVDVDVVITTSVQTAAVLPADIDAILSSDATELQRDQTQQLLDDVDADYLVLITGKEADLDRIPLNDQLTADHAHQFGLAFHELLHILKTAIITIGQLLDTEIDPQYHEQAHDLINIIEDGAIESEAIHGKNFSDNAGIRLELTRRLHSQTSNDIPEDQQITYSFWDAVTSCLYDLVIYPTGITDVLSDESDDRIVFKSDADRQAFEALHEELETLAREALAMRSADREDTTHTHDKAASVRRAKCVIETWTTHIQPLLEDRRDDSEEGQTRSGPTNTEDTAEAEGATDPLEVNEGRSEESSEENRLPREASDGSEEYDEEPSGLGASRSGSSDEADSSDFSRDFDPSDISLNRDATHDPYQDIFDHPQITPDPDLDEIDVRTAPADGDYDTTKSPSDDQTDVDEDGDNRAHAAVGESSRTDSTDAEEKNTTSGEQTDRREDAAHSHGDGNEGNDSPGETSRAQSLAEAAERARKKERLESSDDRGTTSEDGERCDTDRTASASPSREASTSAEQDPQLTFGDFNGEDGRSSDDASPPQSASNSGTENSRSEESIHSHPKTPLERRAEPEPVSEGPAHARSSHRSSDEDRDVYEEALTADERAAHDEATRESIDEQALEEELSGLAEQLERDNRDHNEDSGQPGWTRGGLGGLDEIELLPISTELVPPGEWTAVEDGADQVGDTLETYLRLERRQGERTGLTAGTYDTRAGHRLSIGDPRVCKTTTPGREKRYCLVLVLDRSGSMRHGSPPKIEVATQALARFAVAAEGLGIKVAIIDFIRGHARLVKPFSVETRHVQATLLDTSCGGGTPLADAIGLARQLIASQRDEPLIITVTDDEPSDVEAVQEQLRDSYAPVCSLTIATDCSPGTLSPDASELATYYERQAAVYSPDRLDDRLDQFASLLAGL